MNRPAIVIRPHPGLEQTLDTARAQGLEARGFPLFEIAPVEWDVPDPSGFDGLLIGSANAFRHGGPGLEKLRHLPVHAVGETTAEIARQSGFTVASVGEGGLAAVVASLGDERRQLLRLSGRERVELSPPPAVEVLERIVYEAQPQSFPAELTAMLASEAVVLLHSAAAARHFAEQCEADVADRGKIAIAALGPRIAEAAGTGWSELRIATRPSDPALLELVREMCQKDGGTARAQRAG